MLPTRINVVRGIMIETKVEQRTLPRPEHRRDAQLAACPGSDLRSSCGTPLGLPSGDTTTLFRNPTSSGREKFSEYAFLSSFRVSAFAMVSSSIYHNQSLPRCKARRKSVSAPADGPVLSWNRYRKMQSCFRIPDFC